MITRTAIFEGQVRDGHEDEFFKTVEVRLAPLWSQFPHAENVRWYRIIESDPDARPVAMIQQIDYPSKAALEEAVKSPVRDKARALTMELMKLFDGRFYHLVSGDHS